MSANDYWARIKAHRSNAKLLENGAQTIQMKVEKLEELVKLAFETGRIEGHAVGRLERPLFERIFG